MLKNLLSVKNFNTSKSSKTLALTENLLYNYDIKMKEHLVKNELLRPLRVGETLEGRVIGTGRSAVFLDLGAFGTGIVYGANFYEAKDILKNTKTGDKVLVKIVDIENEDGYIELSLTQAREELSWEALKQKQQNNESIKIKVLKANKGGVLTEIAGIPGFLPTSQLAPEHYPKVENADSTKILRRLQRLIGKELKVKVLDLDPREGKLILSEKAGLTEKTKELLKDYKKGEIVECEATGIVDFGVFVKFPLPSENKKSKESQDKTETEAKQQLEGLIHISELDWQIIENPSDIVTVGQKLKAKIVEIVDNKVSLSLKALKKDPWKNVDKKYKKGDVIKGKVIKFNPFGAFVQIAQGIQGLCHISEFGTQTKMEETLEINKEHEFEILSIEAAEHRMNLKTKLVES